jgi:hypothetical protein
MERRYWGYGIMWKVPWAEPLEKKLKPYQGFVVLALVAFMIGTLWILWKGNATGRTAWLVFLLA